MTSCPTWSFVCSVVRRTLVIQFSSHATRQPRRCAGQRMWIWMKWFIICLIEPSSLEEGCSLLMTSMHASVRALVARLMPGLKKEEEKKSDRLEGRKKEKYGYHQKRLPFMVSQRFLKQHILSDSRAFQESALSKYAFLQIQIKSAPTPSSFHVHTWAQSSEGRRS